MSIYKSGPTQRTKNAIATKKKLFKTALALFSKYGFKEVTVDDIVKKAGVSKGTFYLYFPSKESVLIEQFRQIDEHYLDVYKDIRNLSTASEKICAIMDAMCEYFVNVLGVHTVNVIYSNQLSANDSLRLLMDESRPIYQIMREIVEDGQEKGEFPHYTSSTILTQVIMRWARGLVYDWCMSEGANDIQKDAHGYFSFLLELMKLSTSLNQDNPIWGQIEYINYQAD